MSLLYSLSIFLYGTGIRIAALFNAKARLWLQGRKNIFDLLEKKLEGNKKPVVWFHCASLGEFEQGRPVMEKFKNDHPGYFLLLTFFSPSGYEVRKNYPVADLVTYLPLDTRRNAKRFIEIAKPSVAFFVKYEFWLNFLSQLRRKKIPHFLFSAIFREDQVFFKWWAKIFRDALKGFSFIFTQEKNSVSLLQKINITNVEMSGDTRFDRVAEIAAGAKEIPVAKNFAGNEKVIVAGSSWPADEELLFPILSKHLLNGWKLIVAPHELTEDHLASIEKKLREEKIPGDRIVRFSKVNGETVSSAKILIIDNIGMLSSLYRYGKMAYVGGGFGKSIHNTPEAAVYGIPVVFGPRFEKFNEAKGLVACGGGFGVSSKDELQNVVDELLSDEMKLAEAGTAAGKFVSENKGATGKILQKVNALV